MLLFCDSFSTYTNLSMRWTVSANSNIGTSGRFDGSCYDAGIGGSLTTYIGKNAVTLYAGVALKTPSFGGGGWTIIRFLDGGSSPQASVGTGQVEVCINGDGTVQVQRNGTLIGSASTAQLTLNAWHYIEFAATIDPSAGTATIKIDGATVVSLTGQNTRATSNSYANQFCIQGRNTFNSPLFDDVYLCDSTGSFNNTFLGDIKVIGGLPSGNGTLNNYTSNAAAWAASTAMNIGATISDGTNLQRCTANTGDFKTGSSAPTWAATLNATTTDNHVTWTCLGASSAYKLVNEISADDDSSYLSDATVNDQTRLTFPGVLGASAKGVMIFARARKDDAGLRSVRVVAKSGSTTGDNGADLALSTSYQPVTAVFETDPATSAAWTISALNAAEFGLKTTV